MAPAGDPGSMSDKQILECTAVETDFQGNAVTINPNNAQWSVDPDANGVTIASVSTNPTTGAGEFVPLAVGGPSVVHLVDTQTGADGTISLSVTKDTRTGKMTLTFGDPQDPTPLTPQASARHGSSKKGSSKQSESDEDSHSSKRSR